MMKIQNIFLGGQLDKLKFFSGSLPNYYIISSVTGACDVCFMFPVSVIETSSVILGKINYYYYYYCCFLFCNKTPLILLSL